MIAAANLFKALVPSVDLAAVQRDRRRVTTPRPASTASTRRAAPNRTGSSAGKPGLGLGGRERRPRVVVGEPAGVQRDRDHLRRPDGQREPLVELDELAERRDRVRPAARALDLGRARLVAEDEQMRCAAVVEPERDARVDRVKDRALALDPEQLAAALAPLDDEALGRARDEVGDDGVDRDAPARRSRSRSARSGRRASAGRATRASRSSSSETVIFPIAQSEPTVSTIVPGTARFAPVAVERSAGGRRRSRSSTSWRAASSASSGSSARKTCSPFSMSSPLAMQLFRISDPLGREAPSLRRDTDERGRRVEAERVVDARDDRHAVLDLARAASSRGSRRRRRAGSGARRARSSRSAGRR